jgi:EmrB/QacA subfamily drug resistance transporter
MVTLMAAVFLSLLDAQVVATALLRIVGDLGSLNQFGWVTAGYLIGGTAALPICGKLGDLFGRKQLLVISVVVFLAGSTGSGLAQTMGQLVAFRVVQGVGSGGLFVCVLAIIGEMFSPRAGAKYYGWISITVGVASLAGPTVGGLVTDLFGWRWTFLMNLPIGLAVIAIVSAKLRLPPRSAAGRVRIDYLGAVLLTAAVVALNLLANWAGVTYPWSSGVIIGLCVASVVLVVAFVLSQRRAADPIIPLSLFRNRTISVVSVVNFIAGFVGLGIINYLVLWLQSVDRLGAGESGVILAAMMLAVVVSQYGSARLIGRTGSFRWYPPVSMALFALTALLFVMAGPATPLPLTVLHLLMFGVAAGLNQQALTIAARSSGGAQDMGAVQGVTNMLRQMGTSLGVSVFAAIFASRFAIEVAQDLGSAGGVPVAAGGLVAPDAAARLSPEQQFALAGAYADSLRWVFAAMVPVVVVGFVVSLLFPSTRLPENAPRDGADTDVAADSTP